MKKEKKALTEAQVEKRKELQKTLKSMIAPLVFCGIIAAIIFAIVKYQSTPKEEEPIKTFAYAGDETPIVLENDSLKFEMNPITTGFTITKKSTGKVWESFAFDGENDAAALSAERGKIQSNLILSYSIMSGLETTYDSYNYSVVNGIYEIEVEGDTIKLFYSLGEVEKEYMIPPVITQANFEALTAKMDQKGANLMQDYYKKYDVNKLGKKDDKEALLEAYPILETEVIFVLRDTTKENTKRQMQGLCEEAGYTFEEYTRDKELDQSSGGNDKPVFNVEMDIRLEGDDMVVEIPFSSLESPSDNYIYTITPLPYFAAAGVEDEGFMLVPEGGGALINYNNGKIAQSTYYANMYGWDYALSRDAVVHNTRAYFNVFGQGTEGNSYLCMLEDGVSYAGIKSDISGKTNSYNYVNAVYSIFQREKYDVGQIANSDIYEYLAQLPDEKIVQRYRFLDTDDYVEMAQAYRGYLEDTYEGYFEKSDTAEAPVSVEVVGAVDKVKQILGVPVSRPLELTSFAEMQSMVEDLSGQNIGEISFKVDGWCNGGVKQKLLKHVKTVSALGSLKNLQSLTKAADANGTQVYLNGYTQIEKESSLTDGFFSYRDAAKMISKERAEQFEYSHITYAQRESQGGTFLLHTELAEKMAYNLQSYANKAGAGVAFEDTGMDLSSDFYNKNTYSREATRNKQMDMLRDMDDSGSKIAINMGNDYAIAYVDIINNMDLKGSGYTILDKEIPFYQIAIHGYVDYCGDPLNACGNEEEQLLLCAEYGAGLSWLLMDETSFTLQKTLYTEYYGSEYEKCRDRVISVSKRYNEELGHVFNQEIVDHEYLADDFTCTTYEDGTKVYVNFSFSEDAVAPDGTVVASRDYTVTR